MTTTTTRLARGVHLDHDPDDLLAQLQCLAVALPAHCVVTGYTAARLHELWLPPWCDSRWEIAHTASGRGRQMSRTTRPEISAHRRQLPPSDVVEVDGVRVTTPARTWRDLAARLRLVELVALGDSVLRTGVGEDVLADLVARTRGQRGARNARAALPLLDRRSRSRPESHVRVELAVPGWPSFEVNVAVRDRDGGWLAEPDLSNAEFGVAVDYQGRDHADLDRLRRDLTRDTCVTGERWQLLPVGPSEAFRHTDRLRLAVRQMLLRAGWRPGSGAASGGSSR